MTPRRTRQLDALLDGLHSMDHPTAAELHDTVRRRLPRVSLGTIYRNLEKLIASGEVICVYLDGQPTRYDGMATPHGHFVCQRCGAITDLFEEIEPAVDTARLQGAGYVVRSHSLGVFGDCQRCALPCGGSAETAT